MIQCKQHNDYWMFIEWKVNKKPTILGMASGVVSGLVAITPACAFVTPIGAIWVGAGAAAICYAAVTLLKPKFGYDDSLDAFGVRWCPHQQGAAVELRENTSLRIPLLDGTALGQVPLAARSVMPCEG